VVAIFSDIRILDFSRDIQGMYTSLLMSDMGAEVIKIEPVGGDPLRSDPNYRFYNRGKKSICLDLSIENQLENLHALIKSSDVVVTTWLQSEAKSTFLDYENLSKINPSLLYCSLPPYGDVGPMADVPGDDGTVGTYTGIHEGQGGEIGTPLYVQLPFATYGTAFTASLAVAAGLFERESSGLGQKIEVPLYAGSTSMQATGFIAGEKVTTPRRRGPGPSTGLPVYRLYKCSDEWLFLACGNNVFWNKLCIALECFDLLEDERFSEAPWNIPAEYWEDLATILEPIFASNSREYWLNTLRKSDVPCAPAETREWFSRHPQVLYNEMLLQIPDPELGMTTQVSSPVKFSVSKSPVPVSARSPGEDNELFTNSISKVKIPQGRGNQHPLDNVKVVDLTGYIAGAYGTTLLADLGANVLKIESFAGDGFRQNGAAFQGWNQGKEGMILDLKDPKGLDIFHQLVREADVVAENFRAGIAKKLGVDYQSLKKVNPKIIYSTVNGYGLTGPFSEYPAFDPLIQAQGGAMRDQGGGGDPVFLRIAASDYTSAILSAYGIVSALYYRSRHNKGQHVEISLVNAAFAYQAAEYFDYPNKPEKPRLGIVGQSVDYRLYKAKDGWFFLSCREDTEWNKMCDTIGRLDLANHNKDARVRNQKVLNHTLESLFLNNEVSEWINLFRQAGVKCAPNQTLRIIHDDPQAQALGLTTENDSYNLGRIKLQGLPFKFSRTPGKLELPAPSHGEHTDKILKELKFSKKDILSLRSKGIVG
jgi:crotonobetainyl-CoA:carnitine CoA-transferase CaiB-like acyl-CoA transferase